MTACKRVRSSASGFTLIEVLVGAVLLATALLSAASTSLLGQRLARVEAHHGLAVQTLRATVERMRADLDWPTLYERLHLLEASTPNGWSPQILYPDLKTAPQLGTVRLRVRTPGTLNLVGGWPAQYQKVLLESTVAPDFGLPYDLNGDGVLDGNPKNDDYLSLPLVLELHWTAGSDLPQRIHAQVWLTGERR